MHVHTHMSLVEVMDASAFYLLVNVGMCLSLLYIHFCKR